MVQPVNVKCGQRTGPDNDKEEKLWDASAWDKTLKDPKGVVLILSPALTKWTHNYGNINPEAHSEEEEKEEAQSSPFSSNKSNYVIFSFSFYSISSGIKLKSGMLTTCLTYTPVICCNLFREDILCPLCLRGEPRVECYQSNHK